MITKYEATATFVEGDSGGGTRVSFWGNDEKGRHLRINVSIEMIKALANAYDQCLSTGHAAWHVENNQPAPCSQCISTREELKAQYAQIAWGEEWKRTHNQNGEKI